MNMVAFLFRAQKIKEKKNKVGLIQAEVNIPVPYYLNLIKMKKKKKLATN